MPPRARRDAGLRPATSPSVSPHSSGHDSTILPGDASPDDNPISALRRDLDMQHALHRDDNAELRAATLLMSQLLTQWAAPPPAAPNNAVFAEMLQALNTTALAERATRQLALEESRQARLDAAARDDARAAERRLERVADALERNRRRDEESDRRAREEAARALRVDDELARRALSSAATNTKLHADVQRSFPRAAAGESSEWCAHYVDLCLI